MSLQASRLHYSEIVAMTDGEDPRSVVFTDPMNKFLDDLIAEVDSVPFGDVTIYMGNRITGDALIQFGSRV